MKSTPTLTKTETVICPLHYRRTVTDVSLDSLNQLFSALPSTSILGGNRAKTEADGFSYWAAEPEEFIKLHTGCENPLEKLQTALHKYRLEPSYNDELPKGMFRGGWIGYFAYELGRYIERIPETALDDIQMPLVRLCFYDKVICYDHKTETFYLLALQLPADAQNPDEKLDDLENILEQAKQTEAAKTTAVGLDSIDINSLRCNMTRDYYTESVEKIRRYIYDGQVYQVNFSQRFDCEYNAEPIELFHWQNHHNPSGYSAYLAGDNCTIVSASPEMFVTVNEGRISTKPIKGTRRRLPETSDENIEINKSNFRELVNSTKEQAELNMIIDLERNDLVRICKYGTRYVSQGRAIETYPTVYHAVATVTGELRNDVNLCDILKAMFPGGSITGAPKVSAMAVIDETEPTCRGVYTGSIGYIGIDGSVCLNIAIRTVIIKAGQAFVQVGGGIVADSDAEAEYEETITKARALLAGIKATEGK